MRRPRELIPVYGDFGPSALLSRSGPRLSKDDFDAALWVATKQSQDISQVWAPRWTMFSRGNLSEKNRILGNNHSNPFPGLTASELGQTPGEIDVVDMYVGIGYFAFSYLARGFRRVWGWDLNPWSIEGLRRGCERNGWRCLVVSIAEDGSLVGTSVEALARSLIESGGGETVRCVAFNGDNKWSVQILKGLDKALQAAATRPPSPSIRHVNLGLLPTTRDSWQSAIVALDRNLGGWLHVHENVDVREVGAKSHHIVQELRRLLGSHKGGYWLVECQHVENVKTYAPGVMHCVFDVEMRPTTD